MDTPQTLSIADDSMPPVIGGAVLVAYYDGSHVVKSVVAHVLAFSVLDTSLTTSDNKPALTVAYPDVSVDPAILSSASWFKGYKRETGVVHFTHPLAKAGKLSVVWGYPIVAPGGPELSVPAGAGDNPIFKRPIVYAQAQVSPGQKRLNEEKPLSVQEAADNYKAALQQAT